MMHRCLKSGFFLLVVLLNFHRSSVAQDSAPSTDLSKNFSAFYTASAAEKKKYKALFNGKDFSGWTVFLKDKALDTDAEHNFSAEEGLIHVRGKELGYLRTKESFTDYHFVIEFKWGEKKWPPREDAKRDAGICYNIPPDEPDSIWPK